MYYICMHAVCRTLRHPNIVPLIGVSFEVGSILLIMKYIEGKGLHHILFIEMFGGKCSDYDCNVNLKSSTFFPS